MVIREGRNNDSALRSGDARGPWLSEWEQSLCSRYARAHGESGVVVDSSQEFGGREARGIAWMGRWSRVLVGEFSPHRTLLGYASDCAKNDYFLHSSVTMNKARLTH